MAWSDVDGRRLSLLMMEHERNIQHAVLAAGEHGLLAYRVAAGRCTLSAAAVSAFYDKRHDALSSGAWTESVHYWAGEADN